MKHVFVGVNAKYIHTNPAIRILNKIAESKFDSVFMEFTIKDTNDHIIDSIKDFDCILFSSYIWNIDKIIELSNELRKMNKLVIAGGPEVSYEYKDYINYFDYIMLGEGEEIIIPFLDYLEGRGNIPTGIQSKNIDSHPVYVKDLNNVPDIFDTYSKDDLENRIIYVETSRGCPFNCSYCLSSLEKGVRFFDSERIEKIFNFIEGNKIKCIKFLDRTFNVNPDRFLTICKRLEKTNNTYQFEIEAELFTDDVINYFKDEVTPNKFRLEIGVQTVNDLSLKAVNRNQDSDKLLNIIRSINEKRRVIIHTDLICGLPYETLDSFKYTFNKVFDLKCSELQLGFLKMLRGTKIRKEDLLYNYTYMDKAPYEVLSNKFMTKEDIKIVHECENALEFYWNDKRCFNLINHLFKNNVIDSFFDFFVNANKYIIKNAPLHQNYINIINYLKSINLYNIEYLYDLKLDFLDKSRVKPMPFWRDKTKDNYLEKEYDYKLLGLDESYSNSFITKYYDKFIVIKYIKGINPILEILDLDNSISERIKSKQ